MERVPKLYVEGSREECIENGRVTRDCVIIDGNVEVWLRKGEEVPEFVSGEAKFLVKEVYDRFYLYVDRTTNRMSTDAVLVLPDGRTRIYLKKGDELMLLRRGLHKNADSERRKQSKNGGRLRGGDDEEGGGPLPQTAEERHGGLHRRDNEQAPLRLLHTPRGVVIPRLFPSPSRRCSTSGPALWRLSCPFLLSSSCCGRSL